MECFKLLLEHLAWIEDQFFSGIRDSRKARSLWGMMRSVGGVRKSEHQSWLAKGLGLELLCWGFKGVQEEIPALFKPDQWHFPQNNAPVNNSILVTDYLNKMVIKTVLQPPYSPHVASCDFWLCFKLRDCRYETIKEMKEAVTKVFWHADTRGLPWGLPEVVGTVQQVHCSQRRLFRRALEFHVCTINSKVPIRKKSGNLFNYRITWFANEV